MPTRRQILGATAGTGAAMLAGCSGQGGGDETTTSGGGSGSGSDDTTATTESSGSSSGPTTLPIMQAPNDQLSDWSRLYESTDIEEIQFTPNAPIGQFASRVRQGGARDQFALLGHNATNENVIADVIQEIDSSRIDDWDSYPEWAFQRTGIDGSNRLNYAGEGEETLVGFPGVANADSFIYDESVTGEVSSYGVLFDEQYAGRVALFDNFVQGLTKTALYLKHNNMADIDNPGAMRPAEIETVADFLIEKKNAGQFRTLWSSQETGVNLLVSGEVVAIEGWQSMAALARQRGLSSARYAVTDEGYQKFMHTWMIPDGETANSEGMADLTYQFLNFLNSGYYGAKIAEASGFVMPLQDKSMNYIDENPDEFEDPDALRDEITGTSERLADPKGTWVNWDPQHKDTYISEWSRFKEA
jgi:putative spermidine/putrescine transport system substrate-binding protein